MKKRLGIRELFSKSPSGIRNTKAVSNYLEEKKSRHEIMTMKMPTPLKIAEKQEELFEYHNSDEEDFAYSFTTKVGKARKKYCKLLNISRHPNYTPNRGLLSATPNKKYDPFPVFQVREKYANLNEAFRIKKCFARNNLVYNINELRSLDVKLTTLSLPRGGEMLLKY